jgi:hypothetical protein
MVNYDLPWNPNRIEQRFGRIHRIGQDARSATCGTWSRSNTREGEVFDRLLEKIEQMRLTYGGKVFDVLGEAFTDTRCAICSRTRFSMASCPRPAPRCTRSSTLARLGGRMAKREKGRYEIANVPAAIRASKFSPIATRYERVTFDLEYVRGDGLATADVLAPGHPLHDAVMFETKRLLEGSLRRGTVLISPAVETPQLLVGVVEEVVDGTSDSVARRFGYAFVDEHGTVSPAGPAPYLDCVAAPEGRVTDHARRMPWLAAAEQQAVSWIVTTQLPEYLNQIRPRREAELRRLRELVQSRLESERDRLTFEAMKASEKERLGDRPRESSESLKRKAAELQARLGRRVERIDKQSQMTTKPPSVATAALVLPLSMVEGELPAAAPMHAKETSEVERRGVELVLARERELGRRPIEQSRNNKGFDILSTNASGETFRIEVKARIEGADDFFITHNEVLTAKNAQPRYRLALVRVDPRGAEHDDVRYVADPFATTELGDFDATGIRGDWARTWAKGSVPF